MKKRKSSNKMEPIKFTSIEDLCIAELFAEEFEKAKSKSKGREVAVTIQRGDRYEAKLAEKKRERKLTGKVSTFLGNDVSGI